MSIAVEPTGEVHPVAALFPMMSDEELDDLAADIKDNGLVHPIVLDGDGVLIDGRNRQAACDRVGVEPRYEMLPEGADPVTFILSSNINRRHLTKGQRAMALAKTCSISEQSVRGIVNIAEPNGRLSTGYVSMGQIVLRYAPELSEAVLYRGMPLKEAYEKAQERKAAAQSDEAKLEQLKEVAPDLAELVVDERISLAAAMTALQDRKHKEREEQEKERQYRELTTRQLEQALSFLDPRKVTAEELAEQLSQNLDGASFAIRPDLSLERIRRCAAVLIALADLLSVDNTDKES